MVTSSIKPAAFMMSPTLNRSVAVILAVSLAASSAPAQGLKLTTRNSSPALTQDFMGCQALSGSLQTARQYLLGHQRLGYVFGLAGGLLVLSHLSSGHANAAPLVSTIPELAAGIQQRIRDWAYHDPARFIAGMSVLSFLFNYWVNPAVDHPSLNRPLAETSIKRIRLFGVVMVRGLLVTGLFLPFLLPIDPGIQNVYFMMAMLVMPAWIAGIFLAHKYPQNQIITGLDVFATTPPAEEWLYKIGLYEIVFNQYLHWPIAGAFIVATLFSLAHFGEKHSTAGQYVEAFIARTRTMGVYIAAKALTGSISDWSTVLPFAIPIAVLDHVFNNFNAQAEQESDEDYLKHPSETPESVNASVIRLAIVASSTIGWLALLWHVLQRINPNMLLAALVSMGAAISSLMAMAFSSSQPSATSETFFAEIPESSERATIYVDKRTTSLLRTLPPGVRITFFGSQALQMIHPERRGQLLPGSDIDLYVSDPHLAEPIKTYFSKFGFEVDIRNEPENPNARFTVNRFGVTLESRGDGALVASFRKTTDLESYRDAMAGIVRRTTNTNMDWASAVRGLLYRHRFGFQIEPEALESIREMLRASALVSQDDYGALRKLFGYLTDPLEVLKFLLSEVPLAEFNEVAMATILRRLADRGQLADVLSSPQLADDVKEALKTRIDTYPGVRWQTLTRTAA